MKNLPSGSFILEREKRPFWNNRGLALMAFLIPFVVLGVGYGALQVFPFGGRHMLTGDLFHQYAPFLALLREKLLTGGSLFYTGLVGLGTNFYALFAYYLASPFNLLLLLFPPAYLTEAVLMITLIKVGTAGLVFYHYLRVSFRRRGALAVAFSSSYALSGFVLAYSWNIMWLDTLIFLPLVLLALIRQIRDGKWLLYPLALALLLVTNYYMAFFACLFIALYYPVLLLRYTRDRQPLKRLLVLGKTAGLTILGLGLSALVLYPVWRSLAITSAAGDRFPAAVELVGRPLAYLGQFFPFLQPTVRSGSPNLYCGLPVLILLPLFFISSRVRLREKILNGLLILFLLLSFDINVLNFIWHGLHHPNQLPYRFSFVLILLVLTVAYDGLRSMREFRPAEIGLLGLCLTLMIPVIGSIEPEIKLAPWTLWGVMALMILYSILFSSMRARPFKGRVQVNILIAAMLSELLLSTITGLFHKYQNEYNGNRDSYSAGPTVNSIREAIKQADHLNPGDRFYRLEVRPHKTSNDPALYGYRGLSLFASSSPGDPVSFFRSFGFPTNGVNSFQYRGATLFSEALFGIRYLVVREKTDLDESARQLTLGNDLIELYENPYAFPLAFAADESILDYQGLDSNPFANQEVFASALFGRSGNLFEELSPDEAGEGGLSKSGTSRFNFNKKSDHQTLEFDVTWTAGKSAPHYLYLDMRGHDLEEVQAFADGKSVKIDARKKGVWELGSLQEGSMVRLSVQLADSAPISGSFDARVAALDQETLEALSLSANARGIDKLVMKEDHFSGEITAEEAGRLLVTIPYDPGWKAYLDGQAVPIEAIDQALMSIALPAGSHQVFFAFLPVGFNEGLLVSLASLALLLVVAGGQLSLKSWRKARLKDVTEGEEDVDSSDQD